MFDHKKWKMKGIIILFVVLGLLMTFVMGFGSSGASAATRAKAAVNSDRQQILRSERALRPKVTSRPDTPPVGSVTNWSQTYETNTNGWCGDNPTDLCNDIQGHYGSLDRVGSGFSNYGNYGPFVSSYAGNYHGVVNGTSSLSSGGCPNNGVKYCQGPYSWVNSTGTDSIFPSNGVTVSSWIYVDTSFATNWLTANLCTFNADGSVASCPNGAVQPEFDWDVSINDQTGHFLEDFVAAACVQGGSSADGFVVNFGYASPGSCSGAASITTSGWYDFKTIFINASGKANVEWQVVSSTGTVVVSLKEPITGSGDTQLRITQLGGPDYIWFPTEDIQGLPIDNTSVKLGNHATT